MQYPSFTLTGVTFTGSGGNLIVYPSGYSYSDLGYGPSLTSSPLPAGIAINLPANTFGFGFVIGSGNGIAVNVTIDGGTVLLISNPTNPIANGGNPGVFWGVRSDIALSSLTIAASSTGYRAILDNFTYAGAPSSGSSGGGSAIPEVSNKLLLGGGLLALAMLRRIRR